MTEATGPLKGLRVLELGHYVSAPFCTRLLGDLGAEIIKVEAPGSGDPMRANGKQINGRALWWSSLNRNKKLITLDLRQRAGQEIALQLAERVDVVVENFRAGQLEKWNLGWDVLQQINPRAILVRISGFGQDGPYSDRVCFAPIAEAVSGMTYVTGGVGGTAPVRPNISLGDSVTGLNAFGMLLAAIYERDVGGTGRGRCIDIAMFESLFAMMDAAVTEYGALGAIREPSANTVVFSPSGSFMGRDGGWVYVTASGNAVFYRLAAAIGKPELISDPRFIENAGRVEHRAALSTIISEWSARHDAGEVERILNAASVPASKIFSMADCAADPHYAARGTVLKVDDPHAGPLLHPPIAARFDANGSQPGVAWTGGALGEHNHEVFADLLGMPADTLDALRREAVI
ncbi:CaiB/BaiF CoA-transferase family protein [Variovorax sp. J22P168]|uniref:CaiB/BaiF CoA transferase family protein n=1 Tax=Variovorax jilinensis TaxID=3053513 RepID=UPI00257680D5|nr:CaiB/BaiF CoA-transferase family protein [Variovorax sp. J22P168]MDM0015163.1 CaiB/BaiF CoA-transferase family protein [Variovorax sp. J22P168]